MNLTPNQLIALVVAGFAAFQWYSQSVKVPGPAPEAPKEPVPPDQAKKQPRAKLEGFKGQVQAVLNACPYAGWDKQKEYLLSGDDIPTIVFKEMNRLGNAKEVPNEG